MSKGVGYDWLKDTIERVKSIGITAFDREFVERSLGPYWFAGKGVTTVLDLKECGGIVAGEDTKAFSTPLNSLRCPFCGTDGNMREITAVKIQAVFELPIILKSVAMLADSIFMENCGELETAELKDTVYGLSCNYCHYGTPFALVHNPAVLMPIYLASYVVECIVAEREFEHNVLHTA